MKRFWLVMLSLGLIVAFSTSAMAVDVKVKGSYYAAGMHLDKTAMQKDIGPSTSFYYQRLRVGTQFVVSPGLTLDTRFDALERVWGQTRSAASTTGMIDSMGTAAENENIAFDLCYLTYYSPVGRFLLGSYIYGIWGTQFGDSEAQGQRLEWTYIQGPWYAGVGYFKSYEGSKNVKNSTSAGADLDADLYYPLRLIYFLNGTVKGQIGTLIAWTRGAQYRNGVLDPGKFYMQDIWSTAPYFKLAMGKFAVEGELAYGYGKAKKYEAGVAPDITFNTVQYYLDAKVDLGQFYVGGTYAYTPGDDAGTADTLEGGLFNGGYDWQPCLLMFNSDRYIWAGSIGSYDGTSNDGRLTNAYFFQVRGGVRPTDKLDVKMSFAYAKADKPNAIVNRDYGYEVDLVATYKITNNLSYMLGGGYWFVGDYYKGLSNAQETQNNYIVTNKLTLTF